MSLFGEKDATITAEELNLEHDDRSLLNEARRVIADISFGVTLAEVSSHLPSSDMMAYINVRTLELADYCIEITASGYAIVSHQFNKIDDLAEEDSDHARFESYEPLMHHISPMFVRKFNDSVAAKLNQILK